MPSETVKPPDPQEPPPLARAAADGGQEVDAMIATMAVMAHGLLNAMSVVMGTVDLLDRRWDDLTAEQRAELFASLKRQGGSVVEGLRDMMRGIPEQLANALDEIDAR